MLFTGLFVVHNTLVGSQNESAELTGWEDSVAEVLEVLELKIEVGGDHTALVESSVEVNADLSTSGIIDDLELTNVSMLLHAAEELDESLGDWSEDNLKFISIVSTQFHELGRCQGL